MKKLTYIEKMRAIAKMIEDAVKEKGYICHVSDVEYSSSVGYDVYGVYVCEKDKYVAEFGDEKE